MPAENSPTVVEVLRFDDLPLGSLASRRAVVRWSDGSEGEALRWYSDEVKFSEGDLLGKSPRAAPVAALPPGPRLAAVLTPRPPGAGQSVSPSEVGSQCWQRWLRSP